MKIYTEEQLERAIDLAKRNVSKNSIVESLTPIELPSDEEVNKEALNYITYSGFTGFTTCAVWMRDKIINNK